MMLIRKAALAIVGLTSGISVAAGVFAFITMIGIVPRMAAKTETARMGHLYEGAIIWGGIAGNLLSVFRWELSFGLPGILLYGAFSGVFVGCLAAALAEVLKVFPVFIKRTKLRYGLPWLLVSMAFGKVAGSLYQFLAR